MSADPLRPETYPRRILLAVTGLSPQVVTETLYHLCRLRQPPFIPTEIHLITTREGGQHAELTLLHPHQGRFRRFLADFGLQGQIAFGNENIHILHDSDGLPLEDIRTDADNTAAADTITALVAKFAADADSALHVSLAGGRKTLSYYLGYALTLFGRPQDRLSHVLVSPPFESNHQFYYPPPEPEVLFTRDNKPINTADASIALAEIPFVTLRHGLPTELQAGTATFSATVEAVRQRFRPPNLAFDYAQRTVYCGDTAVRMPPQIFAFYAWLARRRKDGANGDGFVRHTDDIAAEFLAEYKRVVGGMANSYEKAEKLMKDGMPEEFFEEKKSRGNSILERILGLAAAPYLIESQGEKPLTRFGVGVAGEAIRIG